MSQETRGQELLYKQLLLLNSVYPTTPEFDQVFRKTMFANKNKAAFQEVTYYLLKVLNPDLVKNSISCWPIYEPRLEATFRTEVNTIINKLRAEGAPIQPIMASHLIAPGGYKFLKFMLSLSRYVMYVHLKRNSSASKSILEPIKPHRDVDVTKDIIKGLSTCTKGVQEKTRIMFEQFLNDFDQFEQEAEKIRRDLDNCNRTLAMLTDQNKNLQENSENMKKVVQEHISKLNSSLKEMKKIEETIKKCETLLKTVEQPLLEYKGRENGGQELDLVEFYSSFNKMLRNFDVSQPISNVEDLEIINNGLIEINSYYEVLMEKIVAVKNDLLNRIDVS